MESEKEIWEQEHLKREQSGDATECGEADKLHLPKEGSISPLAAMKPPSRPATRGRNLVHLRGSNQNLTARLHLLHNTGFKQFLAISLSVSRSLNLWSLSHTPGIRKKGITLGLGLGFGALFFSF